MDVEGDVDVSVPEVVVGVVDVLVSVDDPDGLVVVPLGEVVVSVVDVPPPEPLLGEVVVCAGDVVVPVDVSVADELGADDDGGGFASSPL